MENLHNTTFDELRIGATLSVTRSLSATEIDALGMVAGEPEALHLDRGGPGQPAPHATLARSVSATGLSALVSGLINRQLPGPGSQIVAQDLHFQGRVAVGDSVTVNLALREKSSTDNSVVLDCLVANQRGETMLTGSCRVVAPTQRIAYGEFATPEVIIRHTDAFAQVLGRCLGLPPATCAVVHPCDRDALLGAVAAQQRGLITPVLVGPEARIRALAAAEGIDLAPYRLVNVDNSHAAAARAVAMARAGEVEALMKGSLHTDELMAEVVNATTGLRSGRRISHVFVMDVPAYPRLLLITDAAISIAPTLEDKVGIVQNAIDLAHILGVNLPKVAILSAVETINPKIASTLDAAALCKMADRGQITGGILDGPLAYDNAISGDAARTKHIVSAVAGQADILLVPGLEAGNMLAKQLQYLAGADSAGIVLGARVPIVLTSRADSVRTRLSSAALVALVAQAQRSARGAAP